MIFSDAGIAWDARRATSGTGVAVPASIARSPMDPAPVHPPTTKTTHDKPRQQVAPDLTGLGRLRHPQALHRDEGLVIDKRLVRDSLTGLYRSAPEPRPPVRPPAPWSIVLLRFHTCQPVWRGFPRVIATVRTIHRSPDLCAFRAGSAPDGHSTPRSLSSRANDATVRPRARSANIHRAHGSGASTCTRRPHRPCTGFGCRPPSTSRHPQGGRPPRNRYWTRA